MQEKSKSEKVRRNIGIACRIPSQQKVNSAVHKEAEQNKMY